MKKQKIKFVILETLFSLLYVVILYLATYIMQSDDIHFNIRLIGYFISIDEISFIVIPFLILLNEFIIIKSIVKDNLKTNIILTVITLIITVISYYKFKILEMPFLPSDILLIKNIKEIFNFGFTFPNVVMIGLIIVLILLLVLHYINRKPYYQKQKWTLKTDWYRIPLFLVRYICNI